MLRLLEQKRERPVFSDSFIDELADKVAARVLAALSGKAAPAAGGLRALKEAAKYLSLSQTTLKLMIAQGELPIVRRGKRRMIAQEDLDRWIATHRTSN